MRTGRAAGPPLTLKPRSGAVSAGTVKQSFSHGRSKTVVVETKRRRVDGPRSAGPAPLLRPTGFEMKPRPVAEAPPRPAPAPAALILIVVQPEPVA